MTTHRHWRWFAGFVAAGLAAFPALATAQQNDGWIDNGDQWYDPADWFDEEPAGEAYDYDYTQRTNGVYDYSADNGGAAAGTYGYGDTAYGGQNGWADQQRYTGQGDSAYRQGDWQMQRRQDRQDIRGQQQFRRGQFGGGQQAGQQQNFGQQGFAQHPSRYQQGRFQRDQFQQDRFGQDRDRQGQTQTFRGNQWGQQQDFTDRGWRQQQQQGQQQRGGQFGQRGWTQDNGGFDTYGYADQGLRQNAQREQWRDRDLQRQQGWQGQQRFNQPQRFGQQDRMQGFGQQQGWRQPSNTQQRWDTQTQQFDRGLQQNRWNQQDQGWRQQDRSRQNWNQNQGWSGQDQSFNQGRNSPDRVQQRQRQRWQDESAFRNGAGQTYGYAQFQPRQQFDRQNRQRQQQRTLTNADRFSTQQSQRYQPQGRQNQWQRQSSIQGQITRTGRATLQGNGQERLVTQVQTQDGRTLLVDMGPLEQYGGQVSRGDRVTINGQLTQRSGRQVLLANSFRPEDQQQRQEIDRQRAGRYQDLRLRRNGQSR